MSNKNAIIGFIGTGVMGNSMASNLLAGGYNLLVYNRTRSKADNLVKNGARWKNSVEELARESDIVISIVGYPKDVEETYLGENGVVNNAKRGSTIIDMTTSKPSLAKKIYEEAKKKGLYSLDAPVSGGDVGAKNGTLSIMVGGDRNVFEKVKPIFELMGKNIVLQGPAGSGQHTKMCNQIAIAANMMGVCEAMAYAKKSGLDPETVLKSIEVGGASSWSLSNLAPRMIKGDFKPGFYVKHFIKDMNIALDEAKNMNLETPALKLSKSLYDELLSENKGDCGTQVLYKLLDK
ncbi:NAD-binding protein [Clostridium tyrobutyricum]|jgi:3-hydroxyisobutyrate dehydrogenase|uniref:2-hydroxy-3-oxopropionate reductase n=1 Tax=Clostridium tyrobutyricum DIVETGP TaxID=1408889 RepID=W6N5Z5_CLOTY|nr:NAD(P)-dependent oxidoreductase [Clostridium tyrobutyricum]AND85442.1 oxidoreductase [Clostridium tyrobutyricum]ANP69989.1 oxidoreductase [Clostridium tyrobutyricum]MBV4421932.1 NAD(P)-dependent oxidoreductase [Clostridium tyrobutyricum]MBV4428806.1 NAD(P)-dependent oxidoreductase [Clostridium tyrobutyricum]MBV4430640.1 NAD(P)-dependent oxidoreductase [Clostridium tyrobutyricum]